MPAGHIALIVGFLAWRPGLVAVAHVRKQALNIGNKKILGDLHRPVCLWRQEVLFIQSLLFFRDIPPKGIPDCSVVEFQVAPRHLFQQASILPMTARALCLAARAMKCGE